MRTLQPRPAALGHVTRQVTGSVVFTPADVTAVLFVISMRHTVVVVACFHNESFTTGVTEIRELLGMYLFMVEPKHVRFYE